MGKSSVFQYVHIGGVAYGVPVGGSIRNGRNIIRITGAGKPQPYELRPGLLSANGSMDLIMLADNVKALFDLAIYDPTTKLLTASDIEVGHASKGYKHTGSVVESLEISGAAEEAVRCSLAWQGKDFSETAGGTAPGIPDKTAWIFDQVTIGSITAKVRSFRLSISNSLQVVPVLGDYKPEEIDGTGQEITLSLETLSHEALSLGEAAPTVQDITIVFSGGITITCVNATPEEQEMPIEEDGAIIHTVNFQVEDATIA